MKKLISFFAVVFLFSSVCSAETILLKSGRRVQGDILEQTSDFVKMDVGGIAVTYYSDEISQISGKSVSQNIPSALKEVSRQTKYPDSQSGFQKIKPSFPQKLPVESSPMASSASSETKEDLIIKLIELSGAKKNMQETFNKLIANASLEEIERIRAIFDVDEIIKQLFPIYSKYFTKNELKNLVDFYSSPTGRKLLRVTPQLSEESMKTTLEYFQARIGNLQPR